MKIRVREDLEFYPVEGYANTAWVVRDPLTLTCFQLGAEEHFLLRQLNAARSLQELRGQFEAHFSPRQLSETELEALLTDWWTKQLLLGDPLLLARWQREQKRSSTAVDEQSFWQRAWRNPLVIRFRGWNPQRFLTHITPAFSGIYTPTFLGFSLLLGLLAVCLAIVQMPAILRDMQQLPLLFGPGQWLLVGGCISLAKILHEFGHAITCHRYGGKCHEMGVILLVGIPCLYCNVTDAWTFPKRWQRMAVSAAGIAVDLWLASVCLLLWYFSEPGVWHSVFLLLAVLGSLNSLLLNGNPLMRYDGYYLCSDITGIVNLRSQAIQQARSIFWRMLLGSPPPESQTPLQPGLATYGLLAGVYLWLIILFILIGFYHTLKPWGLEAIAVSTGMVLIPAQLIGSGQRLYREGEREYLQRGQPTGRLRGGLVVLSLLVLGILSTPFPRRAPAVGVLRSQPAEPIVCLEAGVITQIAPVDAELKFGASVFQLSNPELQQELARLDTERTALQAFGNAVQNKRTQLADSTEAITMAAERMTALNEQKLRLETRQQALQKTATLAGRLIPDPFRWQTGTPQISPSADLDPLAPASRGLLLQTGDVLGRVSSRNEFQLLISVEEYWADKISPQAPVLLFIPETGGQPQTGQLLRLAGTADRYGAVHETDAAFRILQQHHSQIPGAREKSYVSGLVDIHSAAGVHWSEYQLCQARIEIPPASLWQRLTEFLHRTWKRTSL